jgi:hypothetical protein
MFGYTIIKKSELKKLQEESSKYLNLVSYGCWFYEFRPFYKVLEKFIKGEVGSHNVREIKEEFARSLEIDFCGRSFHSLNISIPTNDRTSNIVSYTSKLNKNSDNSVEPLKFTAKVQRVNDKMHILRPANGSRPEEYTYEGEGEIIKVFPNFVAGQDYVFEIIKVKEWSSEVENSNDVISKKD